MSYQPTPIKKFFHSNRRFFARQWLSRQKALQIALTGSHGKTNTAYVLSRVLSTLGNTVSTDLNLDTTYNVPITALKVTPWSNYVVFELGIDHKDEMYQHLEIVKPRIGIVTGIAPVHTDKEHLGSLENLIREKRKLIEVLPEDGYAILNYDDINVRNMSSHTKAKIIWYGTDKKKCDVWVDPKTIKVSLEGTKFDLFCSDFNGTQSVSTKLIGKHHVYTIMATYATLIAIKKITNLSLDPLQFNIKLGGVLPLLGRMNVESGPLGITILNDSLRANPASMLSGLETLSEIQYPNGNKISVLGEMGELEDSEEEHKKIGQAVAKLNIDYFIAIGVLQKIAADEAIRGGMDSKQVIWVKNVHDSAESLKKIIKKGDLIYLKGSLLRHVERVLLILEGKKVSCTVTLCPFYHNCTKCSYLEKGYQNRV